MVKMTKEASLYFPARFLPECINRCFLITLIQKDKFNKSDVFKMSPVDHHNGKATLYAVITVCCANKFGDKVLNYDEIDNALEEKTCGIKINTSHLEYQLKKCHYAYIDCAGDVDYIKNMITDVVRMFWLFLPWIWLCRKPASALFLLIGWYVLFAYLVYENMRKST